MESYNEIKARHQAEVNAFPFGAAFNGEQFADMMRKFGLPNDAEGCAQIVSLGAGVFLRRADIPAYKEMSERFDKEMRELRKSHKELKMAFYEEFKNYECQFERRDAEVCAAVGLDWDEVRNDAELLEIYRAAWKLFWRDCVKNDWF